MKAIVALSFGAAPGPANRAIARVVAILYKVSPDYEKPMLILQGEVADLLKEQLEHWREAPKVIRKYTYDRYIDTYEVMTRAKEIIERYGVGSAMIVAHPAHYPRVEAVAKKLGLKLERPPKEELIRIPYNASDSQWWTNSAPKWWSREIPARILYFLKGYIGFRDIFRCSLH